MLLSYRDYLTHGASQAPIDMNRKPVLAIHGGAGAIRKSKLTPDDEAAHRQGLLDALTAGYRVLQQGGSSLDAVTLAVASLEDCPLFNAGRGSVFTSDGTQEMDAAIMDGHSREAGAVAGVARIRNPIQAARRVLEQSPHVLLIGAGAEAFAEEHGLALEDKAYFFSQERYHQLLAAQQLGQTALDHDIDGQLGTVGAVAYDQHGNLAAATSTGGVTNKRPGRVGDSPIIGAGTYADNRSVAVSATGVGEFFMRSAAAYDIAARILYLGQSLEEACQATLELEVATLGGDGGLIAIDAFGNVAMPFSTEGMYRGLMRAAGQPQVWMFGP